jgi:hypothetical protein
MPRPGGGATSRSRRPTWSASGRASSSRASGHGPCPGQPGSAMVAGGPCSSPACGLGHGRSSSSLTRSGRPSSPCSLPSGPIPRVVGPGSRTERGSAASSVCCGLACPGDCRPPASLAAAAQSPAGGGCTIGNTPGCGRSCTTGCWTGWATTGRSTGHGRPSTRLACGPGVGGTDRRESGRPGQARIQVSPADRCCRHPAGGRATGRQHPRLPAAGAAGRRRPGGHRAAGTPWPSPQAPSQTPCRQRLRLPELSKGAAPPRDHPADRPPWDRIQPPARSPPVDGRTLAGLAAGQPAGHRPLRAPRRPRGSVPPSGLRVDLHPQAPTVVKPLQSLKVARLSRHLH